MIKDQNTPWGREGMNRSQWLRRYRAAINMAVQSLGNPAVPSWRPEEILGHVRANSVAAPCEIYAIAMRQSADHRQATQGLSRTVVRIRQAALLAESGAEGEQPPTSRGAALHKRFAAIVEPFELKPYLYFDVYANRLTDIWIDPRTGQPLNPQPEAGNTPGS
jgi:hypothetical protein